MRNSYNKPELKSLYYEEEVEKLPSLDGKTIAITGTTSGTGFIAAKTIVESYRIKTISKIAKMG